MADKPGRIHIVSSRPAEVQGEVHEVPVEDVERALLEQLAAVEGDPTEAMWELAQFYKLSGRLELAMQHFGAALERVTGVEEKAKVLLGLGQTAERSLNFELAERFYRAGLSLEPTHAWTRYFLRNNLGYSLNQLERYEEGEALCREAIAIDPRRANAHKNLGIALERQGRHAEAARAYIAATDANASDGRAMRHLEALLADHPELQVSVVASPGAEGASR